MSLLAFLLAITGPLALWLVWTLQARVERLERELERLRGKQLGEVPPPWSVPPARSAPAAPAPEVAAPPVVPAARAADAPVITAPTPERAPLVGNASAPTALEADVLPSAIPASGPAAAVAAAAIASAVPDNSTASDSNDIPGSSATPIVSTTPISTPPVAPAPRIPDAAREADSGQRWLAWSGAALLVIGLGLFAKVAWDRGWLGNLIPPTLRIVLLAATSLCLLKIGWSRTRRNPTPLTRALTGTGLAGLYLTVVAAHSPACGLVPAPLIDSKITFALLGVVSALGLVTAVSVRSPGVALLALFGGQLALLVAPDSGARYGLLIHQLLIECGVLGAAAWCGWRWVSLLTVGSVFGCTLLWWFERGPGPAPDGLSWLCLTLLALPMLLAPGLRPWLARSALPTWVLGLAVTALVWYLTQVIWLLHDAAPFALALEAVVIAAAGVALWSACRRRMPDDGPTQATALVVAALAVALAFFAALPSDAQAVAWLAEGVALLTVPRWIGVAMPVALRRSGVAVLVLGLLKTLAALDDSIRPDTWLSAPTITLGLGAALITVVAWRCALVAVRDGLDRTGGGGSLLLWPLLLGAALCRLVAEQVPATSAFTWTLDTAAWAAVTAGAVALARPIADPVGRLALLPPVFGAAYCCFCALTGRGGGGLPLLDLPILNLPLLLIGAALTTLALTGRAASGLLPLERTVWGVLAWLLASVDCYTWCLASIGDPTLARSCALVSVTILWASIGITLLALGLKRDVKDLRVISLFAFAGAALKLLLFDLAGHDAGIRVAAFIGLGVFFLAGAHLYQRFGRRLAGTSAAPTEPSALK